MIKNAEQRIIEKMTFNSLSIEGQAIAAVLDEIIAKLPAVGDRKLLDRLANERDNRP